MMWLTNLSSLVPSFWPLLLTSAICLAAILIACSVSFRNRTKKDGDSISRTGATQPWRRSIAAVIAVVGIGGAVFVARPEPSTAAWTVPDYAAGTLTPATRLPATTPSCQNRPGAGDAGAHTVRLSWASSVPGPRFRIEIRNPRNNNTHSITVGTQTNYLMRNLSELRLPTGRQTLQLRVYGTYVSPNGTQWTTQEPQAVSVDYRPGSGQQRSLYCLN